MRLLSSWTASQWGPLFIEISVSHWFSFFKDGGLFQSKCGLRTCSRSFAFIIFANDCIIYHWVKRGHWNVADTVFLVDMFYVICMCMCVCVLLCVRGLLVVFPEEAGQTSTEWTHNSGKCGWQECCRTAGINTQSDRVPRCVSLYLQHSVTEL